MWLQYLILALISQSEASRILAFFPMPSISHQVVFRPLTQELARRGHELVIITPDPAFPKGEAPKNIREIDVHDISYESWKNLFVKMVDGEANTMKHMRAGLRSLQHFFEMQINSTEVQALINDENEHFDLVICEAIIRAALSISLRFKAPVIQISSFGGVEEALSAFGASLHSFLYPEMIQQRVFNLTVWEKLTGLYIKYQMNKMYNELYDIENSFIRKYFGENLPHITELQRNVDLLLLNVHPLWDNNRPVPPGVVYLGGLHLKERKNLTQELQEYFDSSKNGVIYISFGTNVNPSILPPEKIAILVNVFSRLPYDVLWKWDTDVLPGQPNNVKISKWLPQSDMLFHPKVKLFITQAGLQSTDEAIAAAVPMIGIPLLGDQWYNAEQYVQNKIGLHLGMKTITEPIFEEAINTIVNDPKYKQNMIRFRDITRDQPQTPLERAVWWTEYIIRHGSGKHLKAFSVNSTWSEYLVLDVVFVLVSALLVSLGVVLFGIYILISFGRKYFLYNNKVKVN